MNESSDHVAEKRPTTVVATSQLSQQHDTEALTTTGPEKLNTDQILVDWAGPDDPQNPFNWKTVKKARVVAVMAFNTFLTPLASSVFAPGIAEVMKEFKTTSTALGSFVVSIYVLGYVVGPFLIAPMSELYGRVPVYHVCNILFLIFTVACAVAQSMSQLFAFRFLAGMAGACPLTIGSGMVADMFPKEKRAGVMALWAMGPILGPVIGPVAGGFLSQAEGWRWVFWMIAIATGILIVASLFCYQETYAPVLLERKAAWARKETGNQNLKSIYDKGQSTKQLFVTVFARPTKLLLRSPIVFPFSLFVAIAYGYMYLMFTTMTDVFEQTYGFSQGVGGLAYLGFGIGAFLSLVVCGRAANRIATKHIVEGRFTPETRLLPMMFGCWFIPIGLFWYGWSAEAHAHWIMPIIGTGIFGVGFVSVFGSTQTYLVEAYLMHAASVQAATIMLRSIGGAFLPLAGPSMYDRLGLGWGNSLLGFIALAMCPLPFLFLRFGGTVRAMPKFQLDL